MTTGRQFFGWHVVTGLFLNYMVIVGIVIYTLPLFYPALMAEFGWTATQVTLAATVSYFASALVTPLVSPLYDRFSVRRFMSVGAACVVLALALYPAVRSVAAMVALYGIIALSQVFAGQVPVMVILSRWFRRRRGLAMGIVLTATSAGGALFPLLVRGRVAEGDWRGASLMLALASAVMLALPLLFLIRNHPRDKGQEQDGEAPSRAAYPHAQAQGATLGQAIRSSSFYLLAFATGGLWFCINGMLQHQSIIMTLERGADPAALPLLVSAFFWAAIAGKLAFGWLGDRHDKNLVMLLGVGFLLAGLAVLRHLGGGQLYLYAACFGFGFGGTFTMIQLLIAEFYSGAHYGRILGVLTMIDVSAGGLGIPTLGLLQQALGGYMPVLDGLIWLCLAIAATVLVLFRRRGGARQAVSALPTQDGV